jgi:hypothetical protein
MTPDQYLDEIKEFFPDAVAGKDGLITGTES